MQDPIGIPACFSSPMDDSGAVTRSGQSVFMSVYRTKVSCQCRLITITWCKDMLLHGLSVSIEGLNGEKQYSCKIEMKPWQFWRKQGSKRFQLDGKLVEIYWDLKAAKFNGEAEPKSDYYVAMVCEEEVVLLLGDMKKDAYRKTKSRPALIEASMVSRKDHIYGKKSFSTKAKFHDTGKSHEISIECKARAVRSDNNSLGVEPEMVIKIDGRVAIRVKHLQWKFRGNEFIAVEKTGVKIYWDVHDWLFGSGLRHASFIFKPVTFSTFPSPISSSSASSSSSSNPSSSLTPATTLSLETKNCNSIEVQSENGVSEFCFFLYAWKDE